MIESGQDETHLSAAIADRQRLVEDVVLSIGRGEEIEPEYADNIREVDRDIVALLAERRDVVGREIADLRGFHKASRAYGTDGKDRAVYLDQKS
jgi:hypothetical protein